MDSSKIGNFIKEKRRQNNLTQTDLAEHLLTSRENISKWERGLAIPNTEYLKPLCEKLNISVMELLTASDNVAESQEEIVYKLLYKKEKYRKIIKYILFLLCVLLISFLGYFFITNYKSLRVYLMTVETEELHLHNSLLVLSNDKVYITLNSDEKTEYIKIYYEKGNENYVLLETKDVNNSFVCDLRYNNVINKKNMDKIIKNLYIEYTIGDKKETAKLYVYKDYENDLVNKNESLRMENENIGRERSLSIENYVIKIIDNDDTWQIYGNNYNLIKCNRLFIYDIESNKCLSEYCDETKIKRFLEKYYQNGEWNK